MKKPRTFEDLLFIFPIHFFKKIFITLSVFLFIFSPKVNIFREINIGLVISVLFTFIFIIKYNKIQKPKFLINWLLIHTSLMAILAIYYFFSAIFHNNNSFFDFTSICIALAIYPFVGFLLASVLPQHADINCKILNQLLYIIVISVFINSSIIILEFFFPIFKYAIENMLTQKPNSNIDYMHHPFQLRGIASSGGAGLSVMNALSVILLIHLYLKKYLGTTVVLFISLIICISNIFIGRTGLIFSIIFYVFLILNIVRNSHAIRILSILILLFIILITIKYSHFIEIILENSDLINWAFEWLLSLLSGGLSTNSSDELLTMLFIPDNISHLIFGIGHFEASGSKYQRSDSGYIKTLSSIGLPLSIILYTYLFSLLFYIKKTCSCFSLVIISMTIFLLIIEIKEPFLYQNFISRTVMLCVGTAVYIRSQRKYKERNTLQPVEVCNN